MGDEVRHHTHEHGPGPRVAGRLSSFMPWHRHGPSDDSDAALGSSGEGIRALKVSLLALLVTAALQLVIVAFTGSVALLADTVHNLSDALTAVPLWIAFVLGRRGATRRYTYGYGRAEDLAGVFIVAMIAVSAVVAGYGSVLRLLDPEPLSNVGWVLAAGVVGFAGNELVAVYRIRVGRRIGSAALVADGLHARADGFTSLAVAGGALGVMAGYPLADPIVGLLITAAIVVILVRAGRDIVRRLMDAVDPDLFDAAAASLRSVPGVHGLEDLRLRWVGHRLRAEAGIVVDPTMPLVEAHDIASEAHHRLLHDVPKLIDATIHVCPSDDGDHARHAGLREHARPSSVLRRGS